MAAALTRDPYKNFRFKVYFESGGQPVACVNHITGLSWSVDVVTQEQGGSYRTASKLPGKVQYDNVSIERGLTTDQSFQDWADAVWNYSHSNPLQNCQKTVILELCDENGNAVIRYTLINCWVSKFQALPDLKASDNALALEQITIEHEGWSQEVLANNKSQSRLAGTTY